MRPHLGVETGRLLYRVAVSDTPRPEGSVRDVTERVLPEGGPSEVWRSVRATAVEFVGGTTEAEAAVLPIVVEDGVPVTDVEARRIGAADALLANWTAVARPSDATAVLLVHLGETRTTARLAHFRPGASLAGLASGGTDLKPVEFGLRHAVDAVLDSLQTCLHDRVRPALDAAMLRAILEYGLALGASDSDREVRWRGPGAHRLWQPLELCLDEYFAAASAGRFAPMVDEAAGLVGREAVSVVLGGPGAFFPDAPHAFARRFGPNRMTVDPGGVARGAARWREGSTVSSVLAPRPEPVVAQAAPDPVVTPPWAR